MKIQIEFNLKGKASELEQFLDYLNDMWDLEQWTVIKCPKKYKKIVEDYVK